MKSHLSVDGNTRCLHRMKCQKRRAIVVGMLKMTFYTSFTIQLLMNNFCVNFVSANKKTLKSGAAPGLKPHMLSSSTFLKYDNINHIHKWGITMHINRGGGQEEKENDDDDEIQNSQRDDANANANALESYVASVELKDELHVLQQQTNMQQEEIEDDDSEEHNESDFESSDDSISDEEEGACALKTNDNIHTNDQDDNDSISENHQLRKKSNAVGDPDGNSSDDTDDTEDMTFLSDEEELVAELVDMEQSDVIDDEGGMHVMMTDAVLDVQDDEVDNHFQSGDSSDLPSFDDALVNAFLPFIFMPPNQNYIQYMRDTAKDIDMDARRRLDRRTLYRGLLLELLPVSHSDKNDYNSSSSSSSLSSKQKKNKKNKTNNIITNRKYFSDSISRSLTAVLSLATQPRWRKHITYTKKNKSNDKTNSSKSKLDNIDDTWWWKGGLRLYADQNDLDQLSSTLSSSSSSSSSTNNKNNLLFQNANIPNNNLFSSGQEEDPVEEPTENLEEQVALTLSMQETIGMALVSKSNQKMYRPI